MLSTLSEELLVQVKSQSLHGVSKRSARSHCSPRSTSRSRRGSQPRSSSSSKRRSSSSAESEELLVPIKAKHQSLHSRSERSSHSYHRPLSTSQPRSTSRSSRRRSSRQNDDDDDIRKSMTSRSSRNSKASRSTKASNSTRTTSSSRYSNASKSAVSSRRSIDPDGLGELATHLVDNAVYGNKTDHLEILCSTTRSKKLPEVEKIIAEAEMKLAKVEMYPAPARMKASLMTNHDFERCHADDCDDKLESGGERDCASRKSSARSRNSINDQRVSCERRKSRSSSQSRRSSSALRRGSNPKKLREKQKSDALRSSLRSRSKSSSRATQDDVDEESIPVTIPAQEAWDPQDVGQDLPPDMTGKCIGEKRESCYTTVSSMSTTDSYVKKQQYIRDVRKKDFEARRLKRMEQKKQAEIEGCFEEDATYVVEDDESCFPSSFCSDDDIKSHKEDLDKSSRQDSSLYFCDRSQGQSKSIASSSRRSTSAKSRRSSNTVASTPVCQREECCIKHPHILLSDQTDIEVWTCICHCKDPESGRWHTKKMVCRECLEDEENCHYDEPPHHRSFRSNLSSFRASDTQRLHLETLDLSFAQSTDDDVTCSTSSYNDEDTSTFPHSHDDNKRQETINVHPSKGGMGDQTPLEREAEAQRRRFVRRLAARANHFPGNSWCEDWVQYTSNTHLVFGIFFHHPLHPVTRRERCVILLGSMAIGLLLSNLIYLWFVHAELGMDDTVLSLGLRNKLDVTKLMITLWTVGSTVHSVFDLGVWHIKACTLCRYREGNYVSEGAVKCGRTTGMMIVFVTLAVATYLVLLRASEDYKNSFQVKDSDDEMQADRDGESFIQPISLADDVRYYDFILGYIIEFVLAVFLYNPLLLTIVFTGVLGCNGRIPILGGRPREVMREQKYAMRRQRYTMPQKLKLGDEEYEADIALSQELVANF